MADHRMNERAGREAERSTDVPGCRRTPRACSYDSLGLLSCNSSLALLAHTPPVANALLTLETKGALNT